MVPSQIGSVLSKGREAEREGKKESECTHNGSSKKKKKAMVKTFYSVAKYYMFNPVKQKKMFLFLISSGKGPVITQNIKVFCNKF